MISPSSKTKLLFVSSSEHVWNSQRQDGLGILDDVQHEPLPAANLATAAATAAPTAGAVAAAVAATATAATGRRGSRVSGC